MADYPVAETDRRVPADALRAATATVFRACGMGRDDAGLLAGSLVHADLRGVHSHGVIRVPDYVHKMTAGGVDPRGRPVVASRRGGAIVVDGANAMGQVGATLAMTEAIGAAREVGVALAALRGSNHCGALDWYTLRAAAEGMIGLVASNALPTMAPVGGLDKIVGMNPLSIAMPGGREPPLVMDLALGATAHGKIRVYHQKGLPIPDGWAYDARGEPTTDAGVALEGLIQPAGGHKGIALAVMLGALSTLLSGASYGTDLGCMVAGPRAGRDGQVFIAIDVAAFRALPEFQAGIDRIVAQIHASRPKDPSRPILVPGEMERRFEESYGRDGVLLPARTLDDIRAAAVGLGVAEAALGLPGPA